ncbi:MAG: DUF4347 domain-containing protein [Pirellulaceae bacterium]
MFHRTLSRFVPNTTNKGQRKRKGQHKRRLNAEPLEVRALLTRIAFVDSSVWTEDTAPGELMNKADEVVFLDSNSDGIQQMADYLDGRSGVEAIDIISHGDTGQISPVGNAIINVDNIAEYSNQLTTIGGALHADGDILLWGCGVAGTDGTDFVQAIADGTGADVAASYDTPGAPSLGGNWDLEFATGPIEAANLLEDINPSITLSHGSTIFSDNFETGTLRSSLWSVRDAFVDSDSNGSQGPNNPFGTYAAELDGSRDELRTVTRNLSSYVEGELRFYVQAGGNEDQPESDDDLRVQYRSTSGSWITISGGQIDQSSVFHSGFSFRSLDLPSSAFHTSSAFRFDASLSDCCQSNGDGFDNWFIDNVSLLVIGDRVFQHLDRLAHVPMVREHKVLATLRPIQMATSSTSTRSFVETDRSSFRETMMCRTHSRYLIAWGWEHFSSP